VRGGLGRVFSPADRSRPQLAAARAARICRSRASLTRPGGFMLEMEHTGAHYPRGWQMDIDWVIVIKTLIETIVYSMIGIVMFAASFVIIKLVVPFSLTKEIEEDQNTALAILIGSVILGLAIIIAAAIGG
jgi:putative membrane protein